MYWNKTVTKLYWNKNVTLHTSWIAQISRVKSHSSTLSRSNRKRFESVFGFQKQSASFYL